ncbi:prepilin-type N-terminal cleavage/methylation domain-containing protein [Paenibacillus wynnii]|uniref:Prepilin-type N-terminal cleavage/methylation domain-containing protein n=1 Tax=Paenibacillus wynnii TaxID=268407 RepID=A0A098MEE9_9BACL|nr:prepilin-type N-terminal cleavage/methylation domain-containing protein [Paenibacillus wynnii]KGE20431.1 hypothetical protein PWYN_14575 [Paenibacillus wynnii]
MHSNQKQEQGFTLIEVLASIVILSVVSLVLTAFFTQAMTYSKSNQNKTIMVNIARNALFYMEKQDFEKMETFFNAKSELSAAECTLTNCNDSAYLAAFSDGTALAYVLHPTVNNIEYTIDIKYQSKLVENKPQPTGTTVNQIDRLTIKKYLLPVKVAVKRAQSDGQPAYTVEVEGYINDEEIR